MNEQRPFFDDDYGGRYILVEPGFFTMGDASGNRTEQPPHEVQITEPFFCGERPVTQLHWATIMGDNPSRFQEGWAAGLRPVEQVSWHDVELFLSRLNATDSNNERLGMKGEWRLPTESEWEFLARAGTKSRWSFGDRDGELNEYGWHAGNSGASTREVGQKKANPWGFLDLHGQVSEWCQDSWSVNYNRHTNSQLAFEDVKATRRVHRGGSWFTESDSTRCSARGSASMEFRSDGIGFRLVWQPME
tara:strand:- start:541 stop:1281 length:741 start_codon:yes stop_codon:yes gene_type:complete